VQARGRYEFRTKSRIACTIDVIINVNLGLVDKGGGIARTYDAEDRNQSGLGIAWEVN
jgi:hypothetical protein